MATHPIQRYDKGIEPVARRSWWTSPTATAPAVDHREQVKWLKAELSATARIWQSRVATGSFGNSWSLLRSTK